LRILFTGVGLVTGALAGVAWSDVGEPIQRVLPGSALFALPGVLFAAGITPLMRKFGLSPRQTLWFVAASAIGCFVGIQAARHGFGPLVSLFDYIEKDLGFGGAWVGVGLYSATGLIGGVIGSGVFTLVLFRLLIYTTRASMIVVGALLGLLLPLITLEPLGGIVFFEIWQAGFAAALSRAVASQERLTAS
jgi:hypothetical protein